MLPTRNHWWLTAALLGPVLSACAQFNTTVAEVDALSIGDGAEASLADAGGTSSHDDKARGLLDGGETGTGGHVGSSVGVVDSGEPGSGGAGGAQNGGTTGSEAIDAAVDAPGDTPLPAVAPDARPSGPVCGNGLVETGETCDPMSRCMQGQSACVSTKDTLKTPTGDPSRCTFFCMEVPRVCGAADGQCPTSCTNDPDCIRCGNGRVEAGETCDPCNMRCTSDKDNIRTPSGDPSKCTFRCDTSPRPCGPGDGQCPTGCRSDSGDPDCQQPNGTRCVGGSQCRSKLCVDGVCCDAVCGDFCFSCLASATGKRDGQCAPVKAGADPDQECAASDPASCGNDGACDGQGSCRKYGVGTVCSPAGCSPDNSASLAAVTCAGTGAACGQAVSTLCGFGEACKGTVCTSICGESGQVCCTGGSCKGGLTCLTNKNVPSCGACGKVNQDCCPTGPQCSEGQCVGRATGAFCEACGKRNQPCCKPDNRCDEGTCSFNVVVPTCLVP